MSTEKKQGAHTKFWWEDEKFERARMMPMEIHEPSSRTEPLIAGEELTKVIPLSESEEQELAEIGEFLKKSGFLTDQQKERAKILLKRRGRRSEFSTEPSITSKAVKVLTGI